MERQINQFNENGKKHGLWMHKDSNDNIWLELEYNNGLYNGKYKETYTKINGGNYGFEEGKYKNQEKVGLWKIVRETKIREEIFIR